jgi:1-acyl-sn-glycerol-3-phosphate acyltransferase
MAILSPISRMLDPTVRHHGQLGRLFSRCFLWCAGIRLRVEGLEHLTRDGVYVYAVNHESTIDPPVLAAALPPPVRFIAKQELFDSPILGGYLRRGRHVPVRRDDARSAVKSLTEAARCIREEQASVLVFAEGTRSDELRAFKGGAAHLAIQCAVPVVPVAVVGAAEVLPKGSMLVRPGPLRVVVGRPIETSAMTRADRDDLTALLFDRVSMLIAGPQEPRRAAESSVK